MKRHAITSLLLAATLAGCGAAPAPRSTAPPAVPALQRVRVQGATTVVRGDVAPFTAAHLTLRGHTRVTFVQHGARVDFRREVPFTAHLEQPRAGGGTPKRIALFERAAPTGTATVSTRGRWDLVVDFGDSPFTVTLAPVR